MSALILAERARLVELEAIVERGLATFQEVGNALLEIRDSRLYLASHGTFESYCRERWQFTDRRARQLIEASQIGTMVPVSNERQARELVPLLEDEAVLVETWRELRDQYGDGITAEKVRAAVGQRMESERKVAVLGSSDSDEWYTPVRYVEAAREVLGTIDLDPASNAFANQTVNAAVFLDIAQDGLAQPWHGHVFLNPPYGRKGPLFVEKLRHEYTVGNVTEAILLCNAYSTETRWFQPLFDYPICFASHRVDFVHPGRDAVAPPHGSGFAAVFSPFGAIVGRLAVRKAVA
jgi:DNA N-6-adenine-methyltransferase (Dam)